MILQTILDTFRDFIETFLSGLSSMLAGIGVDTAVAAVGGAAAGAAHFLALFIGNGSWPAVLTALGAYSLVWLMTGLIAILTRRGTSS